MISNRAVLLSVLSIALLAPLASGENVILGGAGTFCRSGWKFSATYALEPSLPANRHVNIEGLSDVIHTDAKDGAPDTFHRFFVDPVAHTYWGYDVEVEPSAETGMARLQLKPFSLRSDQLPSEYHPRQAPDVATYRPLPAPQFANETLKSGEVIAIDVMKNPATGQKVVDYIEVTFEPIYVPKKTDARDFAVSDVLLHIVDPSLRVNGTAVAATTAIADRALRSRLVWLNVPGHGRFLLSLCPRGDYAFQKAGVISGNGLSFSWKGDRFELRTDAQITEPNGNWTLFVLAAPAGSARTADDGFSFGELHTIEAFLSGQ